MKPELADMAMRLGAGQLWEPGGPPASLAVVAVPPDAVPGVVAEVLDHDDAEYVTDAASVKAGLARQVGDRVTNVGRYVGGHPMAGRELSGPSAALPDLFEDRPWVLCPDERTQQQAMARVLTMIRLIGAVPMTMTATDHDTAVALVSHSPHIVAALMAAQFVHVSDHDVRLAGPGVTDVTRIAGGNPQLWTEIVTSNARAVRAVLTGVRTDLDRVLKALESPATNHHVLYDVLRSGVAGRARLPGKHGVTRAELATVIVAVGDRPGQLAHLFADVSAAGINVEDVRIEHSPGQPVGLVELDVRSNVEDDLTLALGERGWRIHG
jgi:prephenate dehydrogenase